MPSAEHWDNLAYERGRTEKKVRGRVAPRDSRYSSARRRAYAFLLDSLLAGVIFGVGILIALQTGVRLAVAPFAIAPLVWMVLSWRSGQTPGKQLMGMYVVYDGKPASWKRMAAREILAKGVVRVVCAVIYGAALRLPIAARLPVILVTFGAYLFWIVWDPENQALWDHITHTHVVEERDAF
jgi:uncharacterized RDD family membrane protein YckC